jgi:hypothetical protein
MKKNMILLFFCLNAISLYCQDINGIITKLSLPKEYKSNLKNYTFLELLQKSKMYEETNKKEEFEFNGFSDWRTQKCLFTERIFSNEKDKNSFKTIKYLFENQKLGHKSIAYWESGEIKSSLEIFFYKNGNVKYINDDRLQRKYYFDKQGNVIDRYINDEEAQKGDGEFIKSSFGYNLPKINPQSIKMNPGKLKEIRTNIGNIAKGADFHKGYENFTVEDWIKFNKIKDYLNKELDINIFKNKDVYYLGMSSDVIDLLYEDGAYYYVEGGLDKEKNEWILRQYVHSPDDRVITKIQYHPNGNVKSICQYEHDDIRPRLLGMNSEYNQDGSIIREINLEEEFNLKADSVYSIIRNSKKCEEGAKLTLDFVNRYLYTNYGKIWIINIHCLGNPATVYINDSTGEIYENGFEFYTSEEYKMKYGEEDSKEQEKKQKKKILIIRDIKC